MFDSIEHPPERRPKKEMSPPEHMEIIIDADSAYFTWNDEDIQSVAEELGEPEFPEPRPCG